MGTRINIDKYRKMGPEKARQRLLDPVIRLPLDSQSQLFEILDASLALDIL